MNQVTAVFMDSEIGYGEGEGLDYAIEDCLASVSPVFENETIVLHILHDDEFHKVYGRLHLTVDGTLALTN